MKEAPRRFWLVLAGAVLVCGTHSADAAVVSLKAVRHNGTPISPTNTLAIAPGDTVEAEILIRGWADECDGFIAVYQMTVDIDAGSSSSGCPPIFPLDWPDVTLEGADIRPSTCDAASINAGDRCVSDVDCPVDTSCAEKRCSTASLNALEICTQESDCGKFGDCECPGGCAIKVCSDSSSNAGLKCTQNLHCPGGVCAVASDFIFAAFGGRTCAVDTSSGRFRFGCSLIPISFGQSDEGIEYYGGTLVLVAPGDAAGTYTFPLRVNDGSSFLTDTSGLPGCHPPLTGESLVLEVSEPCFVGACCLGCGCELVSGDECNSLSGVFQGTLTNCDDDCPGGIASASPPNCASDARIPHNIDSPSSQIGWRSVDLTFCPGTDINAIVVEDFSTSVVPNDVLVRNVTAVTPIGGNVLQVDFNRIFPLRHWNCLMHDPSGSEFCWGRHPADTNESLTSNAGDIQHLMDALNGSVSKELWQCDVDRSGACGPGDLVTGIDLLNGADAFTIWMGQTTMETCPTAP